MANYLDQALAKLTEFEGCVPWMYRDTTGNVTVGVGLMLPSAAAAAALPFERSGQVLTAEQIIVEFLRVSSLPPGRLPAFYRQPSSPQLAMSTIQSHLRSMLLEVETALATHLSHFGTLPDPAKLALLDMAYNLGVSGVVHGYPRLLAAIAVGNWAEAAAQSFRHGISAERNAWTCLEFLAAAAIGGVVGGLQAVATELRPLLRWAAFAAAALSLGWLALHLRRTLTHPPSSRPIRLP